MNFTKSPYESFMKEPSHLHPGEPTHAPQGTPCNGCPYWRGIVCVSCYQELLKAYHVGR